MVGLLLLSFNHYIYLESSIVPVSTLRNIYLLHKVEYKRLLTENITKTYKKSIFQKVNNIDEDAKFIAQELKIDYRTENI